MLFPFAEPILPASTSAATSWRTTLQEAHSCPGHNRQRAAVSSAEKAKVWPIRMTRKHSPVRAPTVDARQLTRVECACRDVPAKASNSGTEDAEADNSNIKVCYNLRHCC